jgi:hypothetical protein
MAKNKHFQVVDNLILVFANLANGRFVLFGNGVTLLLQILLDLSQLILNIRSFKRDQ